MKILGVLKRPESISTFFNGVAGLREREQREKGVL
jgi:hypothetical protein